MMKKLFLVLAAAAALLTSPALAQKPAINGVAGPTTSAQFGSIITNPFGTPASGRVMFAVPAANGVLVTNGSSAPSISSTLPSGMTAPSLTATGTFVVNGNTQLGNGGGTTNYLKVDGPISSGSYPSIYPGSNSDANVGINLVSLGSGEFGFYTNVAAAAKQFAIVHTAGANRNAYITGSNGGNPSLNTTAGGFTITPALTLSGALTYGGVTLSNSVTGTGSMVLSASPQLTATAGTPIQWRGALGNPPTSGTTRTGIALWTNVADSGMASMGIIASGGGFWIQSHDNTQSTQYPLSLNPSGGTVLVGGALSYGGVTLSNSVTGTGSMVLSASPTLTGTLTAAAANFSGAVGVSGSYLTLSLNRAAGGPLQFTDLGSSGKTWQMGPGAGSAASEFILFNVTDGVTAFRMTNAGSLILPQALAYGGVTLSNSVTGTGSMVLSAGPTFTGTLTAAAITQTGNHNLSSAASAPTNMGLWNSGGTQLGLKGGSAGYIFFDGSVTLATMDASGALAIASSTGIPAGGTAGMGMKVSSTSNFGMFFGSGAPTLSAAQGSIYLRSDGQPYYNTNGSTGWNTIAPAASVPYNHIGGLVTSRASTTTLTVAAGAAANSTGTVMISLASAMTKSVSGAWASGNNSNGMGNGLTIANNTWYDVCLAYNGGTADVWFDTSNRASTYSECANKPSGVSGSEYRAIGSFLTNGSAQIVAYTQVGNYYWWTTEVRDQNGLSSTGNKTLASVPSGVKVMWDGRVNITSSGGALEILPVGSTAVNSSGVVAFLNGSTQARVMTDTSQQVLVTNFSGTPSYDLFTVGWTDTRRSH